MTTAPLPPGPPPGPVRPRGPRSGVVGPELGTAALATVLTGTLLVALAAVLTGADGALAALIGAGMVLAFFGPGAVVVNAVAAVSPAASLLVALLTYLLQVLGVGLVLLALRTSGALGTTVHAEWVAGALIACTAVWLVSHIFAATRSRQPVYDLPDTPRDGSAASAS